MRKRTVKNRLRISMLSDSLVEEVYTRMRGIADEDTVIGGWANPVWSKVCNDVFAKSDVHKHLSKNIPLNMIAKYV